MFHRRLLLLGAVAAVIALALGAATTRLATGASARAARVTSEAKLASTQRISTRRGAILDRNGRVLAQDEPGWEVAVHFSVITGQWAARQARLDAPKNQERWEAEGDAWEAELRLEYERQIEEMFQLLAEVSGDGRDKVRRRRDRIIDGVQDLQSYLWRRWQEQEEKGGGEPVALEEVAGPIEAETERHVIVKDLTDQQRLLIEGFIAEGRQRSGQGSASRVWQEVELRRPTVRRYPMETVRVVLDRTTLPGPLASDEPMEVVVSGVGTHLVGLMREAWREDVEARPYSRRGQSPDLLGYRVGDTLGRSGIEQSMEETLRGSRGLRRVNVDTGQVESQTVPAAGEDVVLSIDILLQAHIQALMSPEFGLMRSQPWHAADIPEELLGNPLNGAAVVIDIASGDILAAVSMPAAPRSLLNDEPGLLWDDPINSPMLNRAIAQPYQPGSTLKPFVVLAAVTDGVLKPDELVYCRGYLWDDKDYVYRDWIYKLKGVGFGEIDGVAGLARSSNVFMGLMAQRLMDQVEFMRLPWWYGQFGLGQTHNIGLPEEVAGAVGPYDRGLQRNEIEFMAIGQGPVSWTPLQAVTAYARLVSGDLSREPRLIVSPRLPHTDDAFTPTPAGPTAEALAMVLEGMRQGANTRLGTTHHITHEPSGMINDPIFNVEGVTVYAKSGTADPGAFRWIDLNLDGEQNAGEVVADPRDHAWVVALVQPDGAARPTHAIAVVVEYAGSGGRVSGPIVNQVIHALQHHQYLQWPPVR